MRGIIPHLWFDTQAYEAADHYCATFPDSRITRVTRLPATPSGDAELVEFALFDQPFMAISAGPRFELNPSVSFTVSCATADEVDRYWEALAPGGTVLMELGAYPFSERYGWTTDRHGLSWQLSLTPDGADTQRITPTLLFVGERCGQAAAAIRTYLDAFPDAHLDVEVPYGPDAAPDHPNDVMYASFRLAGQRFAAMDSRLEHDFTFNEAVSLLVACDDQAELDRLTEALSAVPEAEQCGWIVDRYGLSWQLAPAELHDLLAEATGAQAERLTTAILNMRRLDLAELRRAYHGQQ